MGHKIGIGGLNSVITPYDAGGLFVHYKIIDKRRENIDQTIADDQTNRQLHKGLITQKVWLTSF